MEAKHACRPALLIILRNTVPGGSWALPRGVIGTARMDNRTLLVSLDIVLMYGEVSAIAHIDMLTGLYTRRKFY